MYTDKCSYHSSSKKLIFATYENDYRDAQLITIQRLRDSELFNSTTMSSTQPLYLRFIEKAMERFLRTIELG